MFMSLQLHSGTVGNFVRTTIATFATGYCVTRFLAEPILLQGPSMEPTIQHNDIIIAEKYTSTFKRNDYRYGDIVVVRSPLNPNTFICKRIVGLPGDKVRINFFTKKVPRGHVWLLGDNRSNSTDSRDFGSLPMGLIIGRVVWRIWPLHRMLFFVRNKEQTSSSTIVNTNSKDGNTR